MPLKKLQEPTLPGHLSQGVMLNLLGYHLAQASIPTDTTFKKYINEPYQLNKLEFTILMLIQANENLTLQQWSAPSLKQFFVTSLLQKENPCYR
jgi:hypothetical protein